MSTQPDFDSTMQRFRDALGAKNFAEAGRAIGLSTSAYANRKRAGSIPYEQIVATALERGIDLNWLFGGRPLDINHAPPAAPTDQLATIATELQRTNERLARIEASLLPLAGRQ